MTQVDLLVYCALGALVTVVLVAGIFILKPEKQQIDIEVRKIRFAAATFTGIMFLFVFISSLYFTGDQSLRSKAASAPALAGSAASASATTASAPAAAKADCCCCTSPTNPGKDIFEKGLTAMFTLAGTIVGYLFGTGRSRRPDDDPSGNKP